MNLENITIVMLFYIFLKISCIIIIIPKEILKVNAIKSASIRSKEILLHNQVLLLQVQSISNVFRKSMVVIIKIGLSGTLVFLKHFNPPQ